MQISKVKASFFLILFLYIYYYFIYSAYKHLLFSILPCLTITVPVLVEQKPFRRMWNIMVNIVSLLFCM